MLAAATFSVPIFFLCSGYFAYGRIGGKGYLWPKIKNLLRYFTLGIFLSFMWDVLGKNFQDIDFSGESVSSFFLFNATEFFSKSYALWFISALVYCYILCSIKGVWKLSWQIRMIIAILLIAALLMLEKIYASGDYGVNFYHYRNFLFVGLPCFFIGEVIAEKKAEVLRHKRLYFAGIIAGLVSIIAERSAAGEFMEYFIGSFVLSISMFMLGIAGKQMSVPHFVSSIIGELSAYIYLFHVFVPRIIRKICNYSNFRGIAFSCFVFLATMVIALLFMKIKNYLKVWCSR